MSIETHVALRPFDYHGEQYDPGQILRIADPNWESQWLVGLGYVTELPKDMDRLECAACHRKFVDHRTLNRHGDKRHGPDWREDDMRALAEDGSPVGIGFSRLYGDEKREFDETAPIRADWMPSVEVR